MYKVKKEDKNNETKKVRLITGNTTGLIRRRLSAFIFIQILSIVHNPVKAIKEVLRIRRLRASVHGNQKILKFVKSEGKYFWSVDYPGLPSENLRKIIKNEFYRNYRTSRKSSSLIPLQTIIWGITNRCMLRCKHCYEWNNIDQQDKLTISQLKEILLKIKQQGIRHIQFSGGEPLIRFNDLIELIRNASSDKIDCWLLTSGFGLTENKAMALKEAGLKGVNISLDHWNKEAHNLFRNNPESYDWVAKSIKNCKNAGIMVSVSLCATCEFVSMENLMQYGALAGKLGAHFIRILEARQVGRFAEQKVLLGKNQIETITKFTLQMNTDPGFKKIPIVTFFGYHQRKLGCLGAGNRYMYIDPNGDFHACPFCRVATGNALSDSFDEGIKNLQNKGCQKFSTIKIYDRITQ